MLPPERMYHNMVDIPPTGQILLLGGQAYHHWGMDLPDVWAYDPAGGSWTEVGSLTAGAVYSAAYDEAAGQVIMLNLEGETWAYDPAANEWMQRRPAVGPGRRCGHRLVYDAGADKVILFGGFKCSSMRDPLYDDTWAYDFQTDTWQDLAPAANPPARIYHGMVYEPAAGMTLIWGGRPETEVEDTELWAYDFPANTWTARQPAGGPAKRYAYPALVHDPLSGLVIMFGGLELTAQTDGRLVDETWTYDYAANTWSEVSGDRRPPGRSHHAMAYSTATGRAILFGGELDPPYANKLATDMWVFDPLTGRWTQTAGFQ